jgi:hypothetical protein
MFVLKKSKNWRKFSKISCFFFVILCITCLALLTLIFKFDFKPLWILITLLSCFILMEFSIAVGMLTLFIDLFSDKNVKVTICKIFHRKYQIKNLFYPKLHSYEDRRYILSCLKEELQRIVSLRNDTFSIDLLSLIFVCIGIFLFSWIFGSKFSENLFEAALQFATLATILIYPVRWLFSRVYKTEKLYERLIERYNISLK